MTTLDIDAFFEALERRQARRFLADPLPITGWDGLTERRGQKPEVVQIDASTKEQQ